MALQKAMDYVDSIHNITLGTLNPSSISTVNIYLDNDYSSYGNNNLLLHPLLHSLNHLSPSLQNLGNLYSTSTPINYGSISKMPYQDSPYSPPSIISDSKSPSTQLPANEEESKPPFLSSLLVLNAEPCSTTPVMVVNNIDRLCSNF